MDEENALGNEIHIPPYVFYEVQRWLNLTNATAKQKIFDSLYAETGISPMDYDVFERAASIYASLTRRGITIGDPDILIAAFCLEHGFTLVTNNTTHYKDIPGLLMANWNL
jgi:predicted nucleic acid-binding protein